MGCDQLLNAPPCNPNRVGDHNRNRSSINYGSLPTNIIILGGGITLKEILGRVSLSGRSPTRQGGNIFSVFILSQYADSFNIKGVVPVGAYGFYREGTL